MVQVCPAPCWASVRACRHQSAVRRWEHSLPLLVVHAPEQGRPFVKRLLTLMHALRHPRQRPWRRAPLPVAQAYRKTLCPRAKARALLGVGACAPAPEPWSASTMARCAAARAHIPRSAIGAPGFLRPLSSAVTALAGTAPAQRPRRAGSKNTPGRVGVHPAPCPGDATAADRRSQHGSAVLVGSCTLAASTQNCDSLCRCSC